jgi:di-heme oxidoreductase (putative peroxidase)
MMTAFRLARRGSLKYSGSRTLQLSLACGLIIASTITQADFGSKHVEQHKRDSSKSVKKQRVSPFDFSSIADTVGILNSGSVEQHLGAHVDQALLEAMLPLEAFEYAFEQGDELFEINYNALDGVGVNVGNGKRFSTLPRPDLKGPMAWASVEPMRFTGPNGDSCISCHNQPVADGGGGVSDNVIRIDPERRQIGLIERQSPHLFGMGAVQLLAEEMTTELQAQLASARTQSCASGIRVSQTLTAKSINFGVIEVSCKSTKYRELEGIDRDLVVKPFEWKGLTAFVRDFVRGASHQELGMQATELVGHADSDFDGVADELSVGDMTALAIYNAAQPRPVTLLELDQYAWTLSEEELDLYGLPLASSDIQSIENGEVLFESSGCESCHSAALTVSNPVFSEPSTHPEYRDSVFPAGSQLRLPAVALYFDITADIPDNPQLLESGQTLGQFERTEAGGAIVRLYGDLKRHNMGSALAEEIDEGNVGSAVFLTENLWGVGSTAPYLHDGRATTLAEAILLHGGEASVSRNQFAALSAGEQSDLIAFLDNLVLYLAP